MLYNRLASLQKLNILKMYNRIKELDSLKYVKEF